MLQLIPLLLLIGLQLDGFVCPRPDYSFSSEARNADFVAIVTLENVTTVETDRELRFTIQKPLKAPKSQESFKKFVIPYKDRPGNLTVPYKDYLIFAGVKQGKISVFRMECCSKEMKKYVDGLLECTDNSALLRYVFPYLESGYKEVALDAYTTFKEQSEDDLYAARTNFDAIKLRTWLSTQSPDFWKYSLYAKLLCYCGDTSDIPLLKQHMDQQASEGNSVSEYLIAIIELNPKEGWELASKWMHKEKGSDSFSKRHAALCALRHCKASGRSQPDDQTIQTLFHDGLKQEDIADMFIDEIRHWKKWDYSRRIFSLYQPETNNMTKRSIVRFALQSPEPRSQTFLALVRQSSPQLIKDSEEILQLEKNAVDQSKK